MSHSYGPGFLPADQRHHIVDPIGRNRMLVRLLRAGRRHVAMRQQPPQLVLRRHAEDPAPGPLQLRVDRRRAQERRIAQLHLLAHPAPGSDSPARHAPPAAHRSRSRGCSHWSTSASAPARAGSCRRSPASPPAAASARAPAHRRDSADRSPSIVITTVGRVGSRYSRALTVMVSVVMFGPPNTQRVPGGERAAFSAAPKGATRRLPPGLAQRGR